MKFLPNSLRRCLLAATASLLLATVSMADEDAVKWDVAPSVKKSVAPVNPNRVTGMAIATIVIAEDGTVVSAVIAKSSDPSLEQPVLAAVKQWLFAPAEADGKPVEAKIKVPFKFQG